MKNLLKDYRTPTNVIVLGLDIKDVDQTFSITDDYHDLNIHNSKNEFACSIETSGYVFVLSEEEFIKYYGSIVHEEGDSCYMIVFKNFVGKIAVEVQNSDTGEDLMIENFDPLEDGILYQTIDDVDLSDISFDAVLRIYRENPEQAHLPFRTNPDLYYNFYTDKGFCVQYYPDARVIRGSIVSLVTGEVDRYYYSGHLKDVHDNPDTKDCNTELEAWTELRKKIERM